MLNYAMKISVPDLWGRDYIDRNHKAFTLESTAKNDFMLAYSPSTGRLNYNRHFYDFSSPNSPVWLYSDSFNDPIINMTYFVGNIWVMDEDSELNGVGVWMNRFRFSKKVASTFKDKSEMIHQFGLFLKYAMDLSAEGHVIFNITTFSMAGKDSVSIQRLSNCANVDDVAPIYAGLLSFTAYSLSDSGFDSRAYQGLPWIFDMKEVENVAIDKDLTIPKRSWLIPFEFGCQATKDDLVYRIISDLDKCNLVILRGVYDSESNKLVVGLPTLSRFSKKITGMKTLTFDCAYCSPALRTGRDFWISDNEGGFGLMDATDAKNFEKKMELINEIINSGNAEGVLDEVVTSISNAFGDQTSSDIPGADVTKPIQPK